MWAKRSLAILCIVCLSLLLGAACTPQVQNESRRGQSSAASTPAAGAGMGQPAAEPSAAEPSGQAQPGQAPPETVVVVSDNPPAPPPVTGETPLAPAAGQSGPAQSGAAPGAGAPLPPNPDAPAAPLPGNLVPYTDSTYRFTLQYPADFTLRTLPADKLAQLVPSPQVSFRFINPTIAASDMADLTPPDLDLRVYPSGGSPSLQSWLAASGQQNTAQAQAHQAGNVSGLKVCADTMVFPGCSYYFIGDGWIYQLIPATPAGEAMLGTFSLN